MFYKDIDKIEDDDFGFTFSESKIEDLTSKLQELQGEIRSVLISPCRKSVRGERINSQTLLETWKLREKYSDLFKSIDERIQGSYTLAEKIRLILYFDAKDPKFCFKCSAGNPHKTKSGDYLCEACVETRKQEKTRKTNKELYGVEYQIASKKTREKASVTLEKRYGVNHNMKVPKFSSKQSVAKRYNKYSKEQIHLIENPDLLYSEYIESKLPLYAIALKYKFGVRFIQLLFKQHGFEVITSRGFSHEQKLFESDLKTITNHTFLTNVRNIIPPKELDIWYPEKRIGIEYHGLYWHSGEDDIRCHEKYKMATENNIDLLQFFDFEVDEKKEIVFSIIRSRLGSNTIKLNARSCELKQIASSEHKNFCNKYHLQGGSVNPKLAFGLYHNGILVSVMSFGKPRFNKKYEWELLRYACMTDTSIRGGASKLLSSFEKLVKPTSLCSFADCRFSNGTLYKNLGFSYAHYSGANYFYIKNGLIVKRYEAQKHKLQKLLADEFNPNLTEKENMTRNGYTIVNDAGNNLFEKIYK